MIVQFTPLIMLDGKANDAIEFYKNALDANIVFKQTFGEEPEARWRRYKGPSGSRCIKNW